MASMTEYKTAVTKQLNEIHKRYKNNPTSIDENTLSRINSKLVQKKRLVNLKIENRNDPKLTTEKEDCNHV